MATVPAESIVAAPERAALHRGRWKADLADVAALHRGPLPIPAGGLSTLVAARERAALHRGNEYQTFLQMPQVAAPERAALHRGFQITNPPSFLTAVAAPERAALHRDVP